MDANSYTEKMMRLGVSESEAKIYAALLERRELSAMEIHQLTNVPRTKVYEITQRMKLRGLCIEKQMGRKKRYQAVEPERALNNLIQEYESELEHKKELACVLGKMVAPLYTQRIENVGISDYVEIIEDLPSIHERYVSLVRNTKHEFLSFVKPPFAYQKNHKLSEQENAEFEILKRGVVARVIYEYPTNKHDMEERVRHIERCVEAGEKARVLEHLPIKMYVFDQKYVLMALDTSRRATSTLTMLVIEHPGLAQAFKVLFDYLWDKAEDHHVLKNLIKKEEELKVATL